MKFKDRSVKAREKFADSLMSLANIIHGAVAVGTFVFPLNAFISTLFTGVDIFSISAILDNMSWPKAALFGIIYFLPIYAGFYAKQKAMNIYDGMRDPT